MTTAQKSIKWMSSIFAFMMPVIFPLAFLVSMVIVALALPFRLAYLILKDLDLDNIIPDELFDKDRK